MKGLTPQKTIPDTAKNQQLLLYVASKMQDNPNYGATILNKVLYYIDSLNYLKHGKAVSTFEYVKQDFGPTPDPELFLPLRKMMIDENKLKIEEREFFGRYQKRLIAIEEYNVNVFTPEELDIINEVVDFCSHKNGSQISDISHNELAWKLAENREKLPLFTFLLTKSNPEKEDHEWAKTQITRFKEGIMSDN